MMRRSRKAHQRSVNGILLLDKPAGITSNEALQKIKRIYRANKAGHTGTLDKPATGMLPLCLGEATKFSAYLLNAEKSYIALAKLGISTTTADATGDILHVRPVPSLDRTALEKVMSGFVGDIKQVPPMYSAVKVGGKRLYEFAYQGISVSRSPRTVKIYRLDLLNIEQDLLRIRVHCSKGTYIRTLVEDIGHVLGCGAHTIMLRRLSTGLFREEQMVTMGSIIDLAEYDQHTRLDKLLLPIDSAVQNLKKVQLSETQTCEMFNGLAISVPQISDTGLVRIYDYRLKFMGIGAVKEGKYVVPERLLKRDSHTFN